MDAALRSGWQERTTQQLVRYEALFKLLDEIQQTENLEEIGQKVAQQWKYFANVACWRLVLPMETGFQILDGARAQAQVYGVNGLDAWDAYHWSAQKPCAFGARNGTAETPPPPEHLSGRAISEIQVLPFARLGQCTGLLSVAARHEPFSELDIKFIRIFGSHLTDRLSSIELRRQTMRALLDKATRDALTGLLNRGAIIERLEQQLAQSKQRGEPLSIVLGDIDFFKIINDNHGHLAGDQVLREVARRLRANTFSGDSLGRYGGEEFLFVLYPCGADEIDKAAERFRRLIAETPILIGADPGQTLNVTLSMGTATVPGGQEMRLEELIKRADNALYRSKGSGRNRVTLG